MEPIVSFEAGRIKAVEGDSGSSQVPITIQLSSASTVDVEVDIETRTGFIEGATAGEDFQAVMNTFTIPAGQTSLAFNIEYFGDTKDESDESFGLKITDARGAEVGPNLSDYFKSIEIVNDDQIDTTTPTPPDQETPTAMPFDLNITQDDRTATISIINSGDPLANPSFDLEIGASLIGASFNETSLGGSGVLLPKVLAINGNLTVNASGSALGTYGTGSTLLTIELDVEDAGSVSINSFNGSVAGIAASADTLPSFNLLEPAPEIADFIEGSFTVGDTLSIDITNLPDWGGFLSQGTAGFQWLRDGQAILGATSDSYMITQADLGSEITAIAEYRDGNFNNRSVTDDQGEIVMAGVSVIDGTPLNNSLTGTAADDAMNGLGGDDVLDGMGGNDLIDGGSGVDTAIYSGNQASYTLTLSPTSISITDRRADGNGTDQLIDMEFLDFDTEAFPFDFNLTQFGGPAGLSESQFESFIELYIAYFNRAPDAVGLNFWGTAFATGTTLEEIATEFINQDETRGTYPDGTSNDTFARSVYDNVLGRTPDDAGVGFWVGLLNTGDVSRDQFILEVLRGTKSELKPELGQAFVDQQIADQAYLSNKIDIGAYFAVHKGMSDVGNASAAMEFFNGSEASIDASVAAIDGYYADALDPAGGEFLLQVVGVLDDPFTVG